MSVDMCPSVGRPVSMCPCACARGGAVRESRHSVKQLDGATVSGGSMESSCALTAECLFAEGYRKVEVSPHTHTFARRKHETARG